ncbi:MAG TPA: nucleotide exchange factor GrpE [Candidatus Saccharimonadales bacterium]|nr:nucleotide exchange factor GrpE [Candidatus Saccharimonadales bacterium]
MNDVRDWKVPKWPFLLFGALLFAFAYLIVWKSPHPIGKWEIIACFAAAGLGSVMGIIPFLLDYRAMGKAIEVNALSAVAEKIQDLEKLATQISAATSQWDVVQNQAEKTAAGAKQIAEKMGAEVREFAEFMQKMNDSEKTSLRLEVEKLHRGESEWLQMLVHIFDHIFALHAAAMRSEQPKLAEQITHFQNACRGTVRRIGLTPFAIEPGEPFDATRHQLADSKQKPPEGSVVAETIGSGYTFQGKLLRPAVVRLREAEKPAPPLPSHSTSIELPAKEDEADELPLGSPD